MLKRFYIAAGILFAASAPAFPQSGQLGANQIWGNPTAAGKPSQPSNIGSFLTPGTGVTITGTPKATIGLASQITAAGPSGSATQTPVLTYNAQGQLTIVTLATIAPPFSAVTGSLACSQEPAFTGDTTTTAGSCANTTVKVNGVAFGTSPATDTLPVITAANTATYTALPNCPSGLLQYTTSTHLFNCGAAGAGTVNTAGTGLTLTGGGSTLNLALNSAVLQASPTNPTGTASASGVMMGVGGTCHLTPTYTTRIEITFYFNARNAGTLNTSSVGVYFGTGTAPANGVAITGTQIGLPRNIFSPGTANSDLAGANGGIITGLTAGTAYWFDVSLSASANTSSLLNVTCTAKEIL